MTENYVMESLLNIPDVSLYYWSDIPYEVDFIIQLGNDVFPVEAKSGKNIKAASIKNYAKMYEAQTKLCVRLSMRNLSYDGNILNIPLYLADELERLVNIALKQ